MPMSQIPDPRPAEVTCAESDVDDEFAAFHARYCARVRAYVQRSFPRCEVDVVVQDTFRRAYAHFLEVRHQGNPWPWLATVARNLARNQVRDDRSCRHVGLEELPEVADPTASPETRLIAIEQMRLLGRALRTLPTRQQQLVRLMISDGMSATEAGDALGLQPANARQQIHRIRTRLLNEFEALGGRLAVLPLVALRALRRHGGKTASYGWQSAALTTAAAVGVGSFALLPAHLGGMSTQSPTTLHAVSVTKSTHVATSPRRTAVTAVTAPAHPV